VPVTAKLSRKFYDQLGDEIATELVEWFNAVDSTYQSQLREINDLNWERFKAEMRASEAGIRGEMRAMEERLLRNMAELRADLIKWMFIFWSGTTLTIAGLLFAFVKMGR
jgi:hypothetical protein